MEKGRKITKQELSNLRWLRLQEVEIERRLRAMERMETEEGDAQQEQRHAEALKKMRALLAEKRRACLEEEARLRAYIYAIPDQQVQLICILRFVKGMSWAQVAAEVGGNTEESVKKACYRWLNGKR